FLLAERLARRTALSRRDAFDLDFFALQLDRLRHGFRSDDFAQAHAAVFDLAFADFKFFLAQLHLRFFLAAGLTSAAWRFLPWNAVIGADLALCSFVKFDA